VYDYTEYELKTRKLKFNAKKPEMLCDGCLQRTPSQALACLFFCLDRYKLPQKCSDAKHLSQTFPPENDYTCT